MAPVTRSKSNKSNKLPDGRGKKPEDGLSLLSWTWWNNQFETYGNTTFIKRVLFDPQYTWAVCMFLLVCEVVINGLIILSRSYTEIDWRAYMQEVEGFLNGTLDYQYLKGDTGPLVYPAGFVYIFTLFYFATEHGTNIAVGQYLFAIIYCAFMYQVYKLYSRSEKVPPYVMFFLTFTSYRIHSIFVLRLFNDPIAMFLLYFAINQFMDGRWTLGSLSYSLAVSTKMNVLLYSPAILCLYLTQLTIFDTVVQLAVCGSLQVVLALPFLIVNPWSYITRSFDLSRVFLYEWTVNWKFLPEKYFLNSYFHIGLLSSHILIMCLFVRFWLKSFRSYFLLEDVSKSPSGRKAMKIRGQLALTPLFICNFIGIVCSRSLHYQFYVWYYHTIPYLLWTTRLPTQLKLMIFGVIEMCWNIFPANEWSSGCLFICHLIMLVGIWNYCNVPIKDWKSMEWTKIKPSKNLIGSKLN